MSNLAILGIFAVSYFLNTDESSRSMSGFGRHVKDTVDKYKK